LVITSGRAVSTIEASSCDSESSSGDIAVASGIELAAGVFGDGPTDTASLVANGRSDSGVLVSSAFVAGFSAALVSDGLDSVGVVAVSGPTVRD
jgi:hypothetical protein